MERGKCVLAIRFENHAEYLKWKYYCDPNRKWEFEVSYPAIMRMEFPFKNSLDVDILCKKIVQLLEFGFHVYSAEWKLEKSQQEQLLK